MAAFIRSREAAIPTTAVRESAGLWGTIASYLPPWLCTAAAWPVSALSHQMWGVDPAAAPWATAGLVLAGVGLTTVTAKSTSGRSTVTRVHTVATTAAASTWVTAATIAGPGTHPLLDMWLMGGAGLALSWNVRKALRAAGKGKGKGGDSELFKAVKLAGTQIRNLEVAPNKVRAQLQLPPGELTTDDVAKAKTRLAGVLSIRSNGVRVQTDPDHADLSWVEVVPKDMLKATVPWPGPSAPGGSISQPLHLGVYEDGAPVVMWLPGSKSDPQNPRNATHVIVMGMNGAGKSHGAKIAWTEILTRRDTCLRVIDPAKGKQTVGAFEKFLDGLYITLESGQSVMDGLLAEITRRADWLGEHGYDQWEEGCGLDYQVLWVEEAAQLVRDSEVMIDVAQQARSAGMSIVLSLQRPSTRNITSDVRAQLGAVWCFGVKFLRDAEFAMSEELIDAGADPSIWKNRRPGCFYLEAPGLDDDRMATPGRTYATDDDELLAAIEAVRGPVPHTTPDSGAAPMPTPTPAAPPRRVIVVDPFRTATLTDDEDTNPPPLPTNPEPDLDGIDADTPMPELEHEHEMDFPTGKITPAQAKQLLVDVLTELQAQGAETVGPKDIPDSFPRSRPWVSGELSRLAATGVLADTDQDGRYRLRPLAHAA